MSVKATDLARLAGVTYRQLDHWTRRGYLTPDDRGVTDSGHPRTYPDEQAALACIMGGLVAAGIEPSQARVYAEVIRDEGAVRFGEYFLVRARVPS